MTSWTAIALACAAAAGAVLAGPPPTLVVQERLGGEQAGRRRLPYRRPARRAVAAGAVVAATLVVVLRPSSSALAVGLVAAVATLGGVALRRRAAARNRAADRRARVMDTCEQLAAELRAGQSPSQALVHAARTWPELEPAVSTARLGGDVPAALRILGQRPGAESLAAVGAGWEVAQRSGAGLAGVLERCAEALRARDATRREVVAALAPARATARLLAVLPLFGLLLGSGVGADPWGFLLGTPAGLVCLAVGCGLALGGLAWVELLADAVEGGS